MVAPAASVQVACDRDCRIDDEHEEPKCNQSEHAKHHAPRHVTLRISEFLGRKRDFLDGEIEPHRKGRAARTPWVPDETAIAVRRLDGRSRQWDRLRYSSHTSN